jgi:DNA helicase II / ATP-dependent DNA helicase PcrA
MSEDVFLKRYKALNKAQKEAVDAIEGPVMVIAGPGTGKTTVLTLRIANILKKTDTPANGILAITYTDAGVKAVQEKLYDIIGSRAYEVAIHTFHSLASACIAEYPDHFVHISGSRQMTDVDQEILVRAIISDKKFKDLRPFGRPDTYIFSILQSIESAKREALSPSDLRKFAKDEMKRIKADESMISTRGATKGKLKAEAEDLLLKCEKTLLLADVYEKYEETKREKRLLDWSDLIMEFLFALKNDELFLRLIQERFLYLLIDEHQDTNDSQNLIMSMVAEFFDTPNIFVVGDEKQAIYRFQGASVENFLSMRKRWPMMKLISLDTNYRSHQTILDASFAMIEKNYEEGEHADLRIKLKSGGSENGRNIEVVVGEDTAAMEEHLVAGLKDISEKEPEAHVAVIVRRNRDLDRVIRLLESSGIPVSSKRSIDIFHHPIGALYFDLLTWVCDNSRLDALANTLSAGLWDLPFDESVEIIRELRAGKVNALKSIKSLDKLRTAALEDGAAAFVILAADVSGLSQTISRDPAFVQVWRGITALAESIAKDTRTDNPIMLAKQMLAYKESAESKSVKVSVGAPDLPIQAMTAHGSKGLEFDYVFLPYASNESWIGRARGSSFVLPKKAAGDDMRDLRRLFYVALTRARRHVVILSASEEQDGRKLTPLRFISELDPNLLSKSTLPRSRGGPTAKAYTKREGRGEKIIALAKETLLTSGLSVTALNHFLNCPSEFIYESVLKMPQAPSASATKGTAMHEAISKIWQNEDRSEKNIEKILIEISALHIDESLLPPGDKDAIKKEIEEDAPVVAKALYPHFATKGGVFTEKWARGIYNGAYGKDKLTIHIHGKLDAIIETPNSVSVFDYKTRQAISEAEIKGETKSSNGAYFRQLVFYKLLLQNDLRLRSKKVDTSLVFVVPDKKGRCPVISLSVSADDIKKLGSEIQEVLDSVWSGRAMEETCGRHDCEYCARKSLL